MTIQKKSYSKASGEHKHYIKVWRLCLSAEDLTSQYRC